VWSTTVAGTLLGEENVDLKSSANLKFAVQIGSLYDLGFWGVDDYSAFYDTRSLTPQTFWGRAIETISGFGLRGFELTYGSGSWRSALARYGSGKTFREALAAKELEVCSAFYAGFVFRCDRVDLEGSWRLQTRKEEILREVEGYADFLHEWGCRILVSSVPFRKTKNVDPPQFVDSAYASTLADLFNQIGYITAKRGVKLALHCETNGVFCLRRDIDLLMLLTDPVYVSFCPDTAHIRSGGSDPAEVVRNHRSRFLAAHWKDYKKVMPLDFPIDEKVFVNHVPYFTTVGEGLVDWMSWMCLLRDIGFQSWAILEVGASPGLATLKAAKSYVEGSLLPIYS